MSRVIDVSRRSVLGAGLALALYPGRPGAQEMPVLRIGALTPLSGTGGAYGPGMQFAIQAAADLVNAAGGAGGRRLEVLAADDQSLPETAVLAARKLVSVNKVQAILGLWSSGATLAVMHAVTLPENILLMYAGGAEDPAPRDKDLVFRFAPASKSYGVIYAKIAAELGAKRPALLQLNNESGAAQSAGFAETWHAAGGTVGDPVVYQPGKASYRGELHQALRDDPDLIVMASYAEDATVLVREWFQSGNRATLLMPYWAANQKMIGELGKEAVEGIQVAASLPAEENAASRAFDALYRTQTGKPASSNKFAQECWDMTIALALAMELAGPSAGPQELAGRIRDVTNPPGTEVFGFVEGRDALKRGKIKYVGASSRLHIDQRGYDQAYSFAWNTIQDGVVKTRKVLSLL